MARSDAKQARCNVVLERLLVRAGWTPENLGDRLNALATSLNLRVQVHRRSPLALSGHHRSEDHVLFPRLVEERPDLAPVIAQLIQDHHMIEHLLGGLPRAVTASKP